MKRTRLQMLYERPLKPAEESTKELPLEHILAKPLDYYPAEPQDWTFDFVEIGPGRGDFLFFLAQNYPQAKILALELGTLRYTKLKERIQKRKLQNITLIHGDARTSFYKKIPDATLEKCYILFPDPWPRNRHAHRRLLQKDFCAIIASKLKANGLVVLATDVKDYAVWAANNFSQSNTLRMVPGTENLKTQPLELVPTYFQKKWKVMGRDFWYVQFRKLQ